jgi:hypothetical protein
MTFTGSLLEAISKKGLGLNLQVGRGEAGTISANQIHSLSKYRMLINLFVGGWAGSLDNHIHLS